MNFENEPKQEEGSEEYQKALRIIGSIKYVASSEDPGNPEDRLREVVDYAEQLEAVLKELDSARKSE